MVASEYRDALEFFNKLLLETYKELKKNKQCKPLDPLVIAETLFQYKARYISEKYGPNWSALANQYELKSKAIEKLAREKSYSGGEGPYKMSLARFAGVYEKSIYSTLNEYGVWLYTEEDKKKWPDREAWLKEDEYGFLESSIADIEEWKRDENFGEKLPSVEDLIYGQQLVALEEEVGPVIGLPGGFLKTQIQPYWERVVLLNEYMLEVGDWPKQIGLIHESYREVMSGFKNNDGFSCAIAYAVALKNPELDVVRVWGETQLVQTRHIKEFAKEFEKYLIPPEQSYLEK